MEQQDGAAVNSGTKIVLYALGVSIILAGIGSLVTAANLFAKGVGIISIASGLLILILTYLGHLIPAKYVTTIIIIALSGAATTQQPIDVSLLGYVIAITLAGVLIDYTAVLVAGVVAAVVFLVASVLSQTVNSDTLPSLIVAVLGFGLTGGLMALFARTQRRTADEANSRALALEAALSQLRSKQIVEQQTGSAIVGIMERLRRISAEQLSNSQEQVTALAEVTATIEELSQAAVQIAGSAADVNHTADITLAEASRSQVSVNDSLQAMLMLKVQVQQIVERTVALNEKIQGISDVNSSVSSIAAQTHLLALNAAIEAAGAGVAGERFAKVAGEVKKLAQRSQAEATHIRELIQEVQRANAASVMATEQGLKDSDKGAGQARAAADANLSVIDNVGATSSQMEAITMATQQQRSASEQLVDTMYHLKIAARQVASSAAEINGTIHELSVLATQLGALMQATPAVSSTPPTPISDTPPLTEGVLAN